MTHDKNIKTQCTDLKPKIKQIVTKKWQQLWDENPHDKLFQIQPIIKERKLDPNNTRREETTLTYTLDTLDWLTSSFLKKNHPRMSMRKPIFNQAHFERMHKTQPHKQHERTI